MATPFGAVSATNGGPPASSFTLRPSCSRLRRYEHDNVHILMSTMPHSRQFTRLLYGHMGGARPDPRRAGAVDGGPVLHVLSPPAHREPADLTRSVSASPGSG